MWPAEAHAYERGPCRLVPPPQQPPPPPSPHRRHTGIAVNALIAVASLFAKNKVIARIQFSDVTKLGQLVGKANLPQRHGGVERAATGEWVAQRLAAFPRMGLPDDV